MNKKLIIVNWKNHPDSLAEAEQILASVDDFLGSSNLWINDFASRLSTDKERGNKLSLVFCPPFVFTEEVGKILKTSHLLHQAELGAQDISVDNSTALTGEVSGTMLRKLGVRYVIIGHSERRWKLNESNETVNQKLKTALRNEMVPVVCVGDKIRDDNSKHFIKNQTEAAFEGLTADEAARCIIAYEPVWAISTTPGARPDTSESVLESVSIIKSISLPNGYSLTANRYLYGGSITSANAREFLENDRLDGVLIGGASVNKEEFVKILSIAAELK